MPPATSPRWLHPGWLAGLVTIWGVLSLWLFSDGAIAVSPDMLVLYVGGAACGMATLVWIIASSVHRPAGGAVPRRWPWLAAAFLVIAAVPSLCRYAVPFRLRLALSRPALMAVAHHSRPGDRSDVPARIGWLRVHRRDTAGSAVRFFTGTCAFTDECGVVYSPGGPPPRAPSDGYLQLDGPWWSVVVRR